MKRYFAIACLLLSAFAGRGQTPINSKDPTAALTPPPGQPSTQLDFQTDLFTGRFGYSVSLPMAPARHGSTPSAGLHYTSGGEDGWCGVGWELDLGYIERETRYGVPALWPVSGAPSAYDDAKGFVFSLNGRSSPLVKMTDGTYRAQIEGCFLLFKFDTANNLWKVTDKSGNNYYFGEAAASRMSNPKWTGSGGTFRWALSKVITVNGDLATYGYTTISNKLYPAVLAYNGHTNGNNLAPDFKVTFNLADRPDTRITCRPGYKVTMTKRLDSIVHQVGTSMVWSNKIFYTNSPSTGRSLITQISRFGTDQSTRFPDLTFGYSQQAQGLQTSTNWRTINLPTSGVKDDYFNVRGECTDLVDMDGDGLPDWVETPAVSPFSTWYVQLNSGSGFAAATQWNLGVQSDGVGNTTGTLDWTAPQKGRGRVFDINGDGKADRVCDYLNYYTKAVKYDRAIADLNDSTAFNTSQTWTNISDQGSGNYRAVDSGSSVVMMDVNGDGLTDRVMTHPSLGAVDVYNYFVQFNTGAGFGKTNYFGGFTAQTFTRNADWAGISSDKVRLIDINGDGLPDRVMLVADPSTGGLATNAMQTNYVVELNNGHGFEDAIRWPGLVTQAGMPVAPSGVFLGYQGVVDSDYLALRDVNGDGLPDRVSLKRCQSYTNWDVQLNTGTGFGPLITNWTGVDAQNKPTEITYSGIQNNKCLFIDINGDGLPDRLCTRYNNGQFTNNFVAQLSKGPFPDLLIAVSNGIGGTVSVAYTLSTQYDNHDQTNGTGRQLLPFPQWTVSSLVEGDGINPAVTTTYTYEGGMWGFDRREFNGFAKVTAVDPLGLKSVHYFHQSGGRDYTAQGECGDSTANFAKKGLEYRVDTIGSDGNLYKMVLNKVDERSIGVTSRRFAYVSQTVSMDYVPGTSTYKARADQYVFDDNGNVSTNIDFGQVTSVVINGQSFTQSDTPAYQRITYASITGNANIVDKPQQFILASSSGFSTIIRETQFKYDTAGNPLLVSNRICLGSYAVTTNVYEGWGNLQSQTTPAGVTTTTTYDASYHAFPASQTVGDILTSSFTYEPRCGKVGYSKSPAGLVVSNKFDALLRVIETDISSTPNGNPDHWIAKYDYTLGISGGYPNNSVRVRKADGGDANNGHETWSYMDGLGRTIQTRVESETTGSYRVSDTAYNKRGAAVFTSLPYLVSGTNYTAPANKLGTFFQFDAVGRLTTATAAETATFSGRVFQSASNSNNDGANSPVGPSVTAYYDGSDPWTIVKTDEAGSVMKYLLDGYGRTNKVFEYLSSSVSNATTYAYDTANCLTNVTDCLGNKIQYSLNNLGQVVGMADPDMGVWLYARDAAGRITTQTDANGQKIILHYNDGLGRVSSRDVYDFKNNLAYTISYVYDSSQGDASYTVYPGQLFMMTDKEGWEKHGYDYRGREVKTSRYLSRNGKTYTTQAGYDDMDRVTSTVYPNGGPSITTVYDSGANLSKVWSGTTNFYTANTFDDVGHLTKYTLGNGIATSCGYYTYSQRLQSISNTKQNLSYTYDEVSDVKTIIDNGGYSGTNSGGISATGYDALHRLTSVTRPGSSAISFAYSPIGNMGTNGEATNGVVMTYLTTRLPHAVVTANGKTNAYDLCGNMLVRGSQRLEYDPENRLTVVRTGNSAATFGHSGTGDRLWKQSSTTNGLQVWIGNIYEEKNGRTLFHIYAKDQLVCTFDSGATFTDYYLSDHLRSSTVLTDASGNTSQHYEYYAYGRDRAVNSASAFPVSRRFTEQILDEETGLYWFGRPYAPEMGRFVQPDSEIPDVFNPQYLNRYSYCRNNPLHFIDPSGHRDWSFFYNWVPDSWVNWMYPTYTGPTYMTPSGKLLNSAPSTEPNYGNLALHQQMLGGFDPSDVQTAGHVLMAGAELNPVVGTYNAGYTLTTGTDANSHTQVQLGDRIRAGGAVGAAMLPGLGMVSGAGGGAVRLLGNVSKDASGWRRVVYNSANGEFWVGGEKQLFHIEVLGEATKKGKWRLEAGSVNEQFVGGNARFENGRMVEFNTASGHLPATPELQSQAQSAAESLMGE